MERLLKVKVLGLMVLTTFAFFAFSQEASIDWQAVDEAMGLSGEMQGGGVYKYSIPRTDLQVTSSGVEIDPSLALGSWIAFKALQDETDGNALIMGDLVLTEEEYNKVIAQLQEGGVGQTAIHKHLLAESPRIWWTHIEAEGKPVELANTVRAALEQTGTPLGATTASDESQELDLDTAQLDEIIGYQGKASNGVYKYSIPHAGTFTARGTEIPPAMGTSIALGFQPLGNGKTAINGDFAMLVEEIDPVIQVLRQAGITVVSLHNHMTTVEPRLFFMHFWGEGEATALARGLRAALDQVSTAEPQ